MNHLGSRQRQDTDQGPLKIKKIRTDLGPVLLRQGEPVTPQYVSRDCTCLYKSTQKSIKANISVPHDKNL